MFPSFKVFGMRPFQPPPIRDDTEQIIAKSKADLLYRHEQQRCLTLSIKATKHRVSETKRLLQEIEAVLNRFGAIQ